MLDSNKVGKAQDALSLTLEQILGQFEESEQREAREMIANYVFGYVGASYGLKVA